MSFRNRAGKKPEVLEAVTKTRQALKESFNLTVLDIAIGSSYLNDEGEIVNTADHGEYHFSLMPMEFPREARIPLKILFRDQGLDEDGLEKMRLHAQKLFEDALPEARIIKVDIRRMDEPPLDPVQLDRLQRQIDQANQAQRREKTTLGKLRTRLGDLFRPK